MNQRDRQQAAKLIEAEFRNRRDRLTAPPTKEQLQSESEAVLRELGLTAKVKRLNKLRDQADALHAEISEVFRGLCQYHRNWANELEHIAEERLTTDSSELKKLDKECLVLLAAVETCESRERLAEIFQEAGLA